MSEVQKNKYLYDIKIKFILISILNFSDYILTKFLLNTKLFYEGNIFMKNIIDVNLLSIMIKLLLPCLLFTFIYFRISSANIKQLRYSSILINVCLVYYILINLSHCIWISLYLL